ncbi:uncharacterized protein [Lolium perenne]|uniref:uncharacterized protein isoform X1 n=1 Tax=Lolium perenne TaxID=4522 RepID=UPI003A997D2B
MNNDRFPTEVCNQAPGKRSSNSDYLIAYSRSIIYENELTKCWRRRRWSGTRTHKDCFMTQTHHQNNRCPVDDGGSRHQALGDAGVNTSLQVWINLASKDKVWSSSLQALGGSIHAFHQRFSKQLGSGTNHLLYFTHSRFRYLIQDIVT